MNETILHVVQHRQNQWLGHVLRMKDDRIAKTTLVGRTQGRFGKPRTSWLTSVFARTRMRLGDVIRKTEKRCDWSLLVAEMTYALTKTASSGIILVTLFYYLHFCRMYFFVSILTRNSYVFH